MIAGDGEFLRPMVKAVNQESLETEMAQAFGAENGERAGGYQKVCVWVIT